MIPSRLGAAPQWCLAIGSPLALTLPGASVRAEPPPGYYAAAQGRSGAELREALHTIIDGHSIVSYSATRDVLRSLDEDPQNPANVVLVYSRESKPKSDFLPAPDGWNREHLWPQSYGLDGVEPGYSDLFNLRPEDENVNADRANQFFDDSHPADGGFQAEGQVPEAPLCSQDVNSWEPPDAVKGDIARSMFYMDLRYAGDAPNEADLVLTDTLATISTSAARMGRLTTLLVWDRIDPVDDAERLRNDRIFASFQGNRNPFVDRPDWAALVYYDVTDFRAVLEGARVGLSWPAALSVTQAVVESSIDLVAWLPVPGNPVVVGDRKVLSHAPLSQRQFYRLRLR